MFYFRPFPKINYGLLSSESVNVTDITRRFRFVEKILDNAYIMYEYDVKDNERADVIAEKYYKDASLDWLIYMINEIIDPYFEWVLSYDEFNRYIIQKYGSLEYALQTDHSYYQIIQPKTQLNTGEIIKEKSVRIDRTFYLSLPEDERRKESIYQYEEGVNEQRRRIKLVDPSYLKQILEEVSTINA